MCVGRLTNKKIVTSSGDDAGTVVITAECKYLFIALCLHKRKRKTLLNAIERGE